MMKRLLIASLILAMFTTPVMAGQNFAQAVLNRYRPSPASSATSNSNVDEAIQTLIREGALPLTVSDVVRFLLESNLDVRVDRYSPLLSQYGIEALYRPFEPTLHIGANVSRSTRPTTTQLDGSAAPSILNHNYSIGYFQTLSSGTNIGVNLGVNRNSSNSSFSTFNPSYSSTLSYSISQPLLRNRGRDINTRFIRVAKNNKDQSEVDFEIQLIGMVTEAKLLYWDLVNAREDLKVKQRSLDLAQKTYADNQRQIEVGTLAPIDAVQAEAVVASRQAQLVVASYSGDQLQDQMKGMLTRAFSPALVLAKLNPVEVIRQPGPNDVLPIQEAIQYALESRPEMRRFEQQLKNAEIDVQYSKNQLLPSIDLNASYTQSGIGGTETVRSALGNDTIAAIRKGGFWDSFNQMFGYNFTGYSVGVNVSIPLSNKSAQADYSRLATQKQMLEARRAALEQAIAVEVRNAQSQVEMNRSRIQAAEKALELARKQLAAEEKKNQLGVDPIRFVLDEQKNLTDAETSQLQSLIQYTQSLVRYDQAVGRTLQRNNIEIDKEMKIAGHDAAATRSGN